MLCYCWSLARDDAGARATATATAARELGARARTPKRVSVV
jgi:hypothetical protein